MMNFDKVFSPDPFPFTSEKRDDLWIYGRAEREVFRQQELIREKVEAKLKVGYPGEFMTPHSKIHFRANFPKGVFEVKSCVGTPEIREISLSEPGIFSFTLEVDDTVRDVPCFSCSADVVWESSVDGVNWHLAGRVSGTDIPPHREELPVCKFIPELMPDGIYDVGREIFGYVCIKNAPDAKLFVGESIFEAKNRNPEHFEQKLDLKTCKDGTLKSVVPLAFRYISLENGENAEVWIEAVYTPMELKKEFSCGDAELDAIWARSVYTLRLCTRYFANDGVKRDRLPWAGDLAVSLLSMSESFCEAAPIRDTLAVLGSAGIRNAHINGIFDYTLWYLINFDLYTEKFGDKEFLKQEYFKIVETAEILLSQRLENGLLPVTGWVLIDWAEGDKNCALQMLFFMALESLANLAEKMSDEERCKEWKNIAREVKNIIRSCFYDKDRGLFKCSPESNEYLRHQNFFAVGSVATVEESRIIGENLLKGDLPDVGTPYMKTFEILALIKSGFKKEAIEEIRKFWGGMMECGATTFFEAYGKGKTGTGIYDFYGRPFGLSLCHAWSSAPAFLLPLAFDN